MNWSMVAMSLFACAGSACAEPALLWFDQWDGPGSHQDSISSIAHGPGGTVSAVGLSRDSDGSQNFATVRYSADGSLLWSAAYGNLPGTADDARGVGVDSAGNTYALGASYNGNVAQGGSDYDYVLIKYSPAGQQIWLRRYNGPGNWADQPQSLVVDQSGNCYIAGGVFYQPSPSGAYATDFHVMKYTPAGDVAWMYHTTSAGQRGAIANHVSLDSAGYVYATGYVLEPGANQDFLTVKLAPDGALMYRAQHSTPGFNTGDDEGLVVTADAAGNAFVAGYWRPDPVLGQPDRHLDTLVLKYSPTGTLLWTRSTTRVQEDYVTSITTDATGNVYLGGAWLNSQAADGWLESYSPLGMLRWDYILDESLPGETVDYDENWFVEFRIDSDGTLIAAADNERTLTGHDPTILRFEPDGTLLSRTAFDAGTSTDSCFAMDLDAAGNIYIGGNSYFGALGSDFLVMKLAGAAPCFGDANGNAAVDLDDLLLVLGSMGAGSAGDGDGDGETDLDDLLIVLGNFGQVCQ